MVKNAIFALFSFNNLEYTIKKTTFVIGFQIYHFLDRIIFINNLIKNNY